MKMLRVSASVLAIVLVASTAQAANLLVNGSFETGDFTGWNSTGDNAFSGVQCTGTYVTSGQCGAYLGTLTTNAFLSQAFSAKVGDPLAISFNYLADGGTPSLLSVIFNNKTYFSATNPFTNDFQTVTFKAIAGATNTLQFTYRNDPGFLYLDDVSVVSTAAPAPTAVPGPIAGAGLIPLAGFGAAWFARRRKRVAA